MTSTSRSGSVRKAWWHVDATAQPGHATTRLTRLHPPSGDMASAPEFAAILGLQNLVGNRSVGAMLSESAKAIGQATYDAEPAVQPALCNRALGSLLTGGRPLDADALGAAERRFGRTFGQVRVHEDGPARDAADRLGARAFTYGADVFFAAGEYAPGTRAGDRLLYHELAHVVQQEDGGARPPGANRDSPEERAAEHVAAAPEHAAVDTGSGTAPGIALQVQASGSETTAQQAARLRIFLQALRRRQEEQERIAQLHAPRPRSAAPSPPQAPARRGPAWPQEHPQTWRERVAVSHLEDARAELDRTRLGTPEHKQARLRDMAALKELEEARFWSWFHRDVGLPVVEQAALAAATGPIAEVSPAVRVGFAGLAGFGLGETIQGKTVSLRPSTFGQTKPLTGWNRFAHGLGSVSGLAGGLAPELATIPRPLRGGGRLSARTSTSTAAPAARTPAPLPPAGGAMPIVLEGGGGAMTAEGLAVTGQGGRVVIEPPAAAPPPMPQVFQRPAPGMTRPAPPSDLIPGVEARFATDPAAVVRDVEAAVVVPEDPATIAPPTPPGLQAPWRFPASVPLTGAAGFLFPPAPGGVPMLDEPQREPTMRDPVRPGNLELPAAQEHGDAPIGDAPTRERMELAPRGRWPREPVLSDRSLALDERLAFLRRHRELLAPLQQSRLDELDLQRTIHRPDELPELDPELLKRFKVGSWEDTADARLREQFRGRVETAINVGQPPHNRIPVIGVSRIQSNAGGEWETTNRAIETGKRPGYTATSATRAGEQVQVDNFDFRRRVGVDYKSSQELIPPHLTEAARAERTHALVEEMSKQAEWARDYDLPFFEWRVDPDAFQATVDQIYSQLPPALRTKVRIERGFPTSSGR
jgi:hypothetical protein